MSRLLCVLLACGSVATGVKLSSYDQGAKFDKCISISDFEGKTLDDDITLVDRDAAGCCPAGTVPGAKHQNNYVGAQVICGFKADGTVALSTGTSNSVKTCTYNQCYVYKQGLSCKTDGAKQRLNGCCAAKGSTCATNNCDFGTDCKNYAKSFNNVHNEATAFCTTYHKTYKMEYTVAKTDDQSDNKLQTDKLYVYTPCSGGTGGSSPAASTSTRAKAGLAAVTTLAMGLVFAM